MMIPLGDYITSGSPVCKFYQDLASDDGGNHVYCKTSLRSVFFAPANLVGATGMFSAIWVSGFAWGALAYFLLGRSR
jgi:hypothetical protein